MSPEEWPNDRPDYLFLGRALDRIGEAAFPEAWDRQEIGNGLTTIQAENVETLLLSLRQLPRTHPAAGLWPWFAEDRDDAFSRITQQIEKEWGLQRLNTRAERLAKVHDIVWQALRAGSLASFMQNRFTGEMEPIKREVWDNERVAASPLSHLTIDAFAPFGHFPNMTSSSQFWLFISNASLSLTINAMETGVPFSAVVAEVAPSTQPAPGEAVKMRQAGVSLGIRQKQPKPTSGQIETAYLRYIAENHVSNEHDERKGTEDALGQEISRDAFRAIRRQHRPEQIKPGRPRKA